MNTGVRLEERGGDKETDREGERKKAGEREVERDEYLMSGEAFPMGTDVVSSKIKGKTCMCVDLMYIMYLMGTRNSMHIYVWI